MAKISEFKAQYLHLMGELEFQLTKAGVKADYKRSENFDGYIVSEIITTIEEAQIKIKQLNKSVPQEFKGIFSVVKSSSQNGYRIKISFGNIIEPEKTNNRILKDVLEHFEKSFSFEIGTKDEFSTNEEKGKLSSLSWTIVVVDNRKLIGFHTWSINYGGKSSETLKGELSDSSSKIGYGDTTSNIFKDNLQLLEYEKYNEYYLKPEDSIKLAHAVKLPLKLRTEQGRSDFKNKVGGAILENLGLDKDTARLIATGLDANDIGQLSKTNKESWQKAQDFLNEDNTISQKNPPNNQQTEWKDKKAPPRHDPQKTMESFKEFKKTNQNNQSPEKTSEKSDNTPKKQ